MISTFYPDCSLHPPTASTPRDSQHATILPRYHKIWANKYAHCQRAGIKNEYFMQSRTFPEAVTGDKHERVGLRLGVL